ncbi:MAG: lytic transglycosylase domain-containing protein, partial [Gammaproteobacteria bacterium]
MRNRLGNQVKNPAEALRILKLAHQEATRADLSPELVLAVIDIESRFDRFAISRAGALGLMQVMPFWLEELNRPDDNLFDIHTNLRMGCTILRFYLDKEKGQVAKALARYNGSAGSWRYPNKVLGAYRKRWSNE